MGRGLGKGTWGSAASDRLWAICPGFRPGQPNPSAGALEITVHSGYSNKTP